MLGSRSYNIEANGQTYTRNRVDLRKTEERWEEVENVPWPSSIPKKTDGNCRKEQNLRQNNQEQERARNEVSGCNEKSDITMLRGKDSADLPRKEDVHYRTRSGRIVKPPQTFVPE